MLCIADGRMPVMYHSSRAVSYTHLYELQLVEELDRQTIQYLLPFVCIKAINNEPAFRWKTMLKDAGRYVKNEVLTRLDIPFYKRKGYEHTLSLIHIYIFLFKCFRHINTESKSF